MKPLERAWRSLEGLSVGDAFGERFFDLGAERWIAERAEPGGTWRWTDDTEMALSIFEQLDVGGGIDQDDLARAFATRMDPLRGYGRGAFVTLERIERGVHWRRAAVESFGGMGSWGNGAAMRVAPLGAYFADDLDRCAEEARRSAEVTHAHDEGVAGAIAVAVVAALATRGVPPGEWLSRVRPYLPAGRVRDRVDHAASLPVATTVRAAARALGSGLEIAAFDTVPFCLWSAARHADDFREALWQTVTPPGDRDTTCAIVGGILGARVPVPEEWRRARERLTYVRIG